MSITLLALAVITVGQDLMNNQAVAATQAAATKPVELTKEQKKILVKRLEKLDNETPTPATSREKLSRPSSRTAPAGLEKRKVWLKSLLYKAGFRGQALRTAWAVAMKESTGRPTAYNGNKSTGDKSYGIFQINMIGDLGPARRELFGLDSNKELFDPLTNAEAAYYMTNGGEDWSSWDIDSSGYNGGVSESRYKEWLAQYPKG